VWPSSWCDTLQATHTRDNANAGCDGAAHTEGSEAVHAAAHPSLDTVSHA
jgi:hypothetical protein